MRPAVAIVPRESIQRHDSNHPYLLATELAAQSKTGFKLCADGLRTVVYVEVEDNI